MGGGLEHAITRRIVVALELTPLGPESALSVVVAFCQMFRAGEPVELAIHAYTEPTLDLLQRVRRVVHTMVGEVDGVAPIVLYAQGELGDLPYDDAFAAIGDPLDDALSVARVVHLMHAMRADLDAQSGQRLSLHVAEPMSRSTLLERVTRRPRRSGIQLTPAEPRNPFPEGHFYAPTVDANELASRAAEIWVAHPDIAGIDFDLAGHRAILKEMFPRHLPKFDYPAVLPDNDDLAHFFVDNSQFGHLDCRALFVFLHEWRPRRVIEVGSGYSSLLIGDVNHRWLDQSIDVTAIEPYPRPFLERGIPGVTRLLKRPVQQVGLETFSALQAGDILFVDSSHVSKTGSDVNYLYLEVFPRLARGVRIHVHDIFLPDEYPQDWVLRQGRSWNEQYLLQALLMHSHAFRVIFGSSFAMRALSDEVYRQLGLPSGSPMGGGSFWFERT